MWKAFNNDFGCKESKCDICDSMESSCTLKPPPEYKEILFKIGGTYYIGYFVGCLKPARGCNQYIVKNEFLNAAFAMQLVDQWWDLPKGDLII